MTGEKPNERDALQLMAAFGANLSWSRQKVREKLLPLLLQWDASHPGLVGLFFP